MRLGDLDELKRDICNYLASFMNGEVIGDIVKIIDNAPTVERPQGEWVENQVASCGQILRWGADVVEQKCNKCNKYTLRWRDTTVSEFCSNCGADMRGDKE